jgi:hypothetical protein
LDGATTACNDVSVAGTWSYTGQQTTPELRDLSGSIRVDSTPSLLTGTFELREFSNGVLVGTRTGVVTGCDNSPAVEVQLSAAGFARRHLGTRRADTIAGEWFTQEATNTARGTFRLVRGAVP